MYAIFLEPDPRPGARTLGVTRRVLSAIVNSRAALLLVVGALAMAAAMADGGFGSPPPAYAQATVDYDDDDDRLIDIRTLAQLDAVRHDLDGDGNATAAGYASAFPNRDTSSGGRMGCPSGTCFGYELRADLDFDTDGDGSTYSGSGNSAAGDSGDAYHNNGVGWLPIGNTLAAGYNARFKGNGYAISNMFIKRTRSDYVGLFGVLGRNARVETLGLVNAWIYGGYYVGILTGVNYGTVTSSYTAGEARGDERVGGLVGGNYGQSANVGDIIACYSHANIAKAGGAGAPVGGLVGENASTANIYVSFSTGTVTTDSASQRGGLVGRQAATVFDSFWDTNTTGIADDSDTTHDEGRTTAVLQAPTGYAGLFASWNADVDGSTGNDNPWDFGNGSEYPVLRYGGMTPADQRNDFDSDNDRLIDIRTLAQLDAVRWDQDGDSRQDSVSADNWVNHRRAFSPLVARDYGCPSSGCIGYELHADLDFDTDDDGSTYTGSGNDAAGDPGDAYYNGGSGWAPLSDFSATFKGNGFIISNLFSKRTGTNNVGLFVRLRAAGRVETVSVVDAYIYGRDYVGGIVGYNRGTVTSSYTTGEIRGNNFVGGISGYNWGTSADLGYVRASYSRASVISASGSSAWIGGITGFAGGGSDITASYFAGTVTSTGNNVGPIYGDGAFTGSNLATITSTYWDTVATGIADDANTAAPEGRTTAQLQSPTGYTGIYSGWNIDVSGTSAVDDPWDFGTTTNYPTLKFGGMDPADQRLLDYDLDDDGLLEISTLAQLDAVRYDLDGDGARGTVSGSDWVSYLAAFPGSSGGGGCPDTDDADSLPGPCIGYELAAHLDFDTDGDGSTYTGTGASAASDSGDKYHNGGSGWDPIGGAFTGVFKGNGFVVSNLFIKRTGEDDTGLFNEIGGAGRVESMSVENAYVAGDENVGALAGFNNGTAVASWSSGAVRGRRQVGGLIGVNSNIWGNTGVVIACYSRAAVHSTIGAGLQADAGGLIGVTGTDANARIVASYSSGPVTSASNNAVGGFVNVRPDSTVTNSYYDTQSSGKSSAGFRNRATGKTTGELQTPVGYAGIYAAWNVDVDGETGGDDPWDFGGAGAYPALKYGGMDPDFQRRGDFDQDGDGLIAIYSLAQLNAVRWDLDGDAVQDSTSAADWAKHTAAFAGADAGMGCPDTADAGSEPGPCSGYELAAHLDFDTDGDGATYTGTGASAASDSGDAYHNGGDGWEPIGTFASTFKGNGYLISNLFSKRAGWQGVGLFSRTSGSARIETVSLPNAYVLGQEHIGGLVGENRGTVSASWTTGYVHGNSIIGGLIGWHRKPQQSDAGDVFASYSGAAVHTTRSAGDDAWAGGLIGSGEGRVIASYATGRITDSGNTFVAGLLNPSGTITVTDSYWDTTASGRTSGGSGTGKTTSELQTPTGYAGIYANWNVNVDGAGGGDDPWDFGTGGEYPVLKYGGMDPSIQRGDYDMDDDGLIDISTLEQLNAVRWDLDGDGAQDSASAADWKKHGTAFLNRRSDMGCPAACEGYELVSDLDFDTSGDGSTYRGNGVFAVGDSRDSYYNGGDGFLPIGGAAAAVRYNAVFKGNGHIISNLYVNRSTWDDAGLFSSIGASGRVESLGVENAFMLGKGRVGVLAGGVHGAISAVWVSGEVHAERWAGGLAGFTENSNSTAVITAAYSRANVSATGGALTEMGGLLGQAGGMATIKASYAVGTVNTTGGNRGGMFGYMFATADVSDSYWDVSVSGIADDADANAPEGRTAAQLQNPTGYAGIYSAWNIDVDGEIGKDDPWDFGAAGEYPALKFGGMDPDRQRIGDYDRDGDGLIEISSLAHLNAVRWDLDGDGVRDATADWRKYAAAFPDGYTAAGERMGCPGGSCSGYELAAHLDFDTDGDGATYTGTGASAASDSGDAYHNAGEGWEPIGEHYAATFKGNGYIVSNLFVKRASDRLAGLFANISADGRVESMSVLDAFVHGDRFVGILAGGNSGIITSSWTSGEARAVRSVGGLSGNNYNDGTGSGGKIIASYTDADVHSTRPSGQRAYAAVLVGVSLEHANANVEASYSTGTLTAASSSSVGGLLNIETASTVTNSYWDTTTSGRTGGGDGVPNSAGKTTAELQTPTGYTGIYSAWNVSVDASAGGDDPWDFGTSSEYPVLKYGGMQPYIQRGDYDLDDDGLIEIRTLAQLNAVRWDPDGDGVKDSTSDADWIKYGKAFINRDTNSATLMGCPSGTCTGYELAADLDFDTDGDGATYAGAVGSAVGDSGDAYHNGGAGFDPIGGNFAATFKGNGYVISNLFINRSGSGVIGLFSRTAGDARIESLGIENAYVAGNVNVGAMVGINRGTIAASWTSGFVRGRSHIGGLAGSSLNHSSADTGEVIACYTLASVHSTHSSGNEAWTAGLIGNLSGDSTAGTTAHLTASYAAGRISAASGATDIGGLQNTNERSTVTDSYFDFTVSGRANSSGNVGKTTSEMQAPAGYTGIYANWDVDVDGENGGDDPWDFGKTGEYPVLKYGGMDPERQRRGDYDRDGDGLIDIDSIDRLNAVRWDVDGDGERGSTTADRWRKHARAFPDALAGFGCPGSCSGYELTAHLDFDTDSDGATYTGAGTAAVGDSGDEWYEDGSGWLPIAGYSSTFSGDGKLIFNLFIKRAGMDRAGLFGQNAASGRIESVGVENAYVYGRDAAGALVGSNSGTIAASYSTGAVLGRNYVGGLVGYNSGISDSVGIVDASYTRASAASASGSSDFIGGFVGFVAAGSAIDSSYSTGTVTTAATSNVGGFLGACSCMGGNPATITASYWNTTTSGRTADGDSGGAAGKTTAELQSPTGYAGIYENWNIDVDGETGGDDPWDFGTSNHYPVLKYGGMDPIIQRGDYDLDDDNLIEVGSLAQLNAMRWDVDGDGAQDSVSAADWKRYANAFFNPASDMGCPSTCAGYELTADLDFDTDGDGATYTGAGASAAGDPDDMFYNAGAGFPPIGDDAAANRYNAAFNGNGHVISNLFIKRAARDDAGLFGSLGAGASVESLGVENAFIHADERAGVVAGSVHGAISAVWVSGEVHASRWAGGLAGHAVNDATTAIITAAYSRANVTAAGGRRTEMGGLLGQAGRLTAVNASYATGSVNNTAGNAGGMFGYMFPTAVVSDSYWDTDTSGFADDADADAPEGRTAAQLQNPTGYAGLYSAWNIDMDGEIGREDPWDFGTPGQYPALKFGGLDTHRQRPEGDYDVDGDGLVEISTLAQLNAIRWDLDGDADQDSTSDADWAKYIAAFPNAYTYAGGRMGCPGACSGYELIAHLDFDTDGDGATYTGTGNAATGDSGDDYYNANTGFVPIGTNSAPYTAAFEGNGFAISNLFIRYAIFGSGSRSQVGLFGEISSTARIESAALIKPYVKGNQSVGALVGANRGEVTSSFSLGGETYSTSNSGGLIGYSYGDVHAVYSTTSAGSAGGPVGGLIGRMSSGATTSASYAAGAVTVGTGTSRRGFIGVVAGTIENSYWDANAAGIADDSDTDMPEGKSMSELQTPTGYTGIYENWDVDVDGETGGDDPWDFGTGSQYPVLKYGGMQPHIQRGDYDLDDDGLIEIRTLDQLNAVRWDLDGDAVQDSSTAADWVKYGKAFVNRDTASATLMGCPSGTCAGYELAADLDFDTDGDGATYTGAGVDAAGDSGDAYYNDGAGWDPLSGYSSTFKGSGYVISNLFIKRTASDRVGLFASVGGSGRVESLGLEDAYVHGRTWVGALVGESNGAVAAAWSTGQVIGFDYVGGLAGRIYKSASGDAADLTAGYSRAAVHSTAPAGLGYSVSVGGLIGSASGNVVGNLSSTLSVAYATGKVTGKPNTLSALGSEGNASITHAYYDTTAGNQSRGGTGVPASAGKTTAELQAPLGYAGIYANWNVDASGDGVADDPWHFGKPGEYPVLKYGGMDPERQRPGDYDRDGDGLIEITTLAQLNAVRWDLDGDGQRGSATEARWRNHAAAFPDATAGYGCPDTDEDGSLPGPCLGYELAAHLDFDTDGDGATYAGTGTSAVGDSGDDWNESGAGFLPIGGGSPADRYTATFSGGGHVISNLYMNRETRDDAGLFGGIGAGASVESLGVSNAFIRADERVGVLAGRVHGAVSAVWVSGEVLASRWAGGLAGHTDNSNSTAVITAAYSRANVTASGGRRTEMGGLLGQAGGMATIKAAYATGTVTNALGTAGGMFGYMFPTANVSDSYWDATTSGIADDADANAPEGRTTAQLQTPVGYAGVFANWNVDIDGEAGGDDPWHFGFDDTYPVLKYGGMDPYLQYGGDYDLDDDGLVEITTLARLNAVRWDLDGDGAQGTASDADWQKYEDAFTDAVASMGCPDTDDADMDPGPCLGYELAANLDFDTNGSGSTYNGTGADAFGDSGDEYYNGGEGWAALGSGWSAAFDAEFKGNGYVVSNLFIKRPSTDFVGLFGAVPASGSVESVGVEDAYVYGGQYAAPLVGYLRGLVATSFATGEVRGDNIVGGLVGYQDGRYLPPPSMLGWLYEGSILASYAMTDVHAATNYAGGLVGYAGGNRARIIASYSAGSVSGAGAHAGGLGGWFGLGGGAPMTVTQSYWDTSASGTTNGGTSLSSSLGKTTSELQTPAGYAGIYSGWNIDLGDDEIPDDPWDFGGAGAYPALKYGGHDPVRQRRGDYDKDGDGLIEITALAQLNAVRWDLDGDAERDSVSESDWKKHAAAFPHAAPGFGCIDTADADTAPGPCVGYELIAHLDFDTDGDGATYTGTGVDAAGDSGDAYYNGGLGFEPIGDDSGNRFDTTFKGNGFTISNLFIKRTSANDVGLFGGIDGGARVESLGVPNAYVNADDYVGILAGTNYGVVSASWSDGVVLANRFAGGLVGYIISTDPSHQGAITAGYSRASVRAVPSGGSNAYAGGLTGGAEGSAEITAGYSTGEVTSTVAGSIGGLNGFILGSQATIAASYWDTYTSGIADDGDTNFPEGKTTAELQSVLSYTGIFSDWNVDVDGETGADDPWDFGGAGAYPVLKYAGMDVDFQRIGDYDQDGDGLIEMTTLAQLNAMRWDLDGEGDQDSVIDADWTKYGAAFPKADPGMGCVDTADADTEPGPCAGYELLAHLDFDTDGDGATYTGTGNSATGDSGDAYNNGGAGFEPIGASLSAAYAAEFDGNGHIIRNLFIKRASTNYVGLFGVTTADVRVENVGLQNAYVYGSDSVGGLAGYHGGAIAASYTTGEIRGVSNIGGLTGSLEGGVTASYSRAAVSRASGSGQYAGGLAGSVGGTGSITASYSTGAVTSTHADRGAVAGENLGTITASYWDTDLSGIADDANNSAPEGKTTAELQTPEGYVGIFADWNVDADGETGVDNPWHFGEHGEHPALRFAGMDPDAQTPNDYDRDGDGFIEISTLAQLNAMRWDLDGEGDQDSVSASDWAKYAAAFPGRDASTKGLMGCPAGVCAGYELIANLDFDTDGDGATYTGTGTAAAGDADDEYYNGGSGFEPIGADASPNERYSGSFEGNGHVISNLFIKRAARDAAGLFGGLHTSVRLESLAVTDAYVYGRNYVGIIVGSHYGDISGSYADGEVLAQGQAGGVAGIMPNNSGAAITASYSRANVAQAGGAGSDMGGLVGHAGLTAEISASYSTGTVTTSASSRGGLVGLAASTATITASYWDATASGISTAGGGEGKTTSELQTPVGYTGIYENWNVDADGAAGDDDPWYFGTTSDYPVLKFGGMDPYNQYGDGDYDRDNDGLIEITSLDRLNAVRWDLDGNGAQDFVSDADWQKYEKAFPNAAASLGCPDTDDADMDPGPCAGYEIIENLDFDASGNGYVGDADPYPNWTPIGNSAAAYASELDGNNGKISNLTIMQSEDAADIGLFGRVSSTGEITGVGLVDVNIIASGSGSSLYMGALAGYFSGTARAVYATGTVSQTGTGTGGYVGGLVGWLQSASTIAASWSGAHASAAAGEANAGGIAGRLDGGTVRAAYGIGAVSASGEDAYAGGLAGVIDGGTVESFYTISPITAGGTNGTATGIGAPLPGSSAAASMTAVYWDVGTTDIPDDADNNAPEGVTTSALQSITGYASGSLFANWNANVDGEAGNDDPWRFGAMMMQYPMLKWNGMSLVAQGSLAMGMASPNGNYPVVGQDANVCLADGPAMRASGTRNGKEPWQWQRSTDGAAWTDITYDPATLTGGLTWRYIPAATDVGYYIRACVGLNDTAPEGATRACVRIFAKTQAAPSG